MENWKNYNKFCTKVKTLRKLVRKATNTEPTGRTPDDLIEELAENYQGGGGGGESDIFKMHFAFSGANVSCDKTFEEYYLAVTGGKTIIASTDYYGNAMPTGNVFPYIYIDQSANVLNYITVSYNIEQEKWVAGGASYTLTPAQ